MRAVNAKHGAGDNQFGVNLGKLRGLAGKIKRDHKLALELWKSGNIDAMNLATLIMDPTQLTQPEVEKLAKDLSYYTTTDWFVEERDQGARHSRASFAGSGRPRRMSTSAGPVGR